MRFYVRATPDEEPRGPWSRNELLDHARTGRCGRWTWARAVGEDLWRPLSDVIPLASTVSECAEPDVAAKCEVFRASGLVLMILGSFVALVGALVAFTFDDLLWGALYFLFGLVAGAVVVGMGILVRAVAETLRVILDVAARVRRNHEATW